MAKDKEFEKNYKAEYRRRMIIRKQYRKQNQQYNKHIKGEECEYCGGRMSWCSCCEQWSRSCCVEYGTCQCS